MAAPAPAMESVEPSSSYDETKSSFRRSPSFFLSFAEKLPFTERRSLITQPAQLSPLIERRQALLSPLPAE